MHNLFSCFGNIKAILYLSNSGKCFIEYSNEIFAQSCQTLMNLQFFLGQKLKISFSKRRKVKLGSKKSKLAKKYNKEKNVNLNEQRYSNWRSAVIPRPSQNLLILGIPHNKNSKFTHKNVFNLMKKIKFLPKQIFILKDDNRKTMIEEFRKRGKVNNLEKVLFSVYKYKNVSEEMEILSHAHGLSDESLHLDVSFSYVRF